MLLLVKSPGLRNGVDVELNILWYNENAPSIE